MKRTLDSMTIERLAKLIVDMGGPCERKGYQLEQLLQRSAWADPPEYDGSARITWLVEQIEARNDGTEDIEHLLCRVCDPLEYDGGMEMAKYFAELVNAILLPEQLMVSYVGQRPVLAGVSGDGSHPVYTEPDDLERRLDALIVDKATVQVLMHRLAETRICEANGAYTFAIIGIGSLVEGVLLAILTERDKEFREGRTKDQSGRTVKPERAALAHLIDRAAERRLIQFDATRFMHTVRDFRNFVHPRKELVDQPAFDRDSVMLCWGPVAALLNDLEESLEELVPPVTAG
ncbi:hypothetical protein [Kribbella sp. CA-293567]|uniref:hypothetical protein n=1 Tax=Kribbella sp. CA-293567 TaxID=3002436 RepID=UPI0022DD7C36|nr:hypothetical protein [Kribbella sp. CA-293567]WBQ06539.1 hypothetical protein OX958_07025 [Kribbella sp. CA-293567]